MDDVFAVEGVVVRATLAEAERSHMHLTETMSTLAQADCRADVVDAVRDSIAGTFADRVAFGLVEDEAVRIVAMSGYADDVVAQFADRRIPITASYPVCDAVRDRARIVLDGAGFDRRYPHHASLRRSIGDAVVAAVPVLSGEFLLGVLQCGWSDSLRDVASDVDLVSSIAAVAGGAIRRIDLIEELAEDRFRRALNASVDGVAITRAVRSSVGEIVDFVIEYANDRGVDAYDRPVVDLVGRSVLESYPGLVATGLFERFRDVVDTGVAFVASEQRYIDRSVDPPVDSWHHMHVVRFDDGYLASTRDVTAEVRTRRELESARIAAASETRAVELLGEIGAPEAMPTSPPTRLQRRTCRPRLRHRSAATGTTCSSSTTDGSECRSVTSPGMDGLRPWRWSSFARCSRPTSGQVGGLATYSQAYVAKRGRCPTWPRACSH